MIHAIGVGKSSPTRRSSGNVLKWQAIRPAAAQASRRPVVNRGHGSGDSRAGCDCRAQAIV
jgi:hypothetical protein